MTNYQENFIAWAEECVKITDKISGRLVPFHLNRPQRRVANLLEQMRRGRRPMRMIMLKARQWGGSTLIQMYMAWMQLCVRRGYNSVICAHVKDSAAGIKGMFSRLLREYPEHLKTGAAKDWEFLPYEKSANVSRIAARDCTVAITSSLSPNSLRGGNYQLAHLSEVAFFGDGELDNAEEIVRTVCGSVPLEPDTLIVMESTANGTDNYFHREWQRAVEGRSDKLAVFVPWYEIEIYSRQVSEDERAEVLASLDEYERGLLDRGVPLESVAWYHDKRREYATHEAMMAEFPSTPEEAFATTARAVFEAQDVQPVASKPCSNPRRFLLCIVPGHGRRHHAISVLAADGRGVVHTVSDESVPGTPGQLMQTALARANQLAGEHEGAEVEALVVSVPRDDEPDHSRWCVRKALEMSLPQACTENEEASVILDAAELAACADTAREMMAAGRFAENNAEARAAMLRFRADRPWEHPHVCARLAALAVMGDTSPAVNYSDLVAPDFLFV